MSKGTKKIRYESFGGIIFSEKLASTVFVDKDYMRTLNYKDCTLWRKEQNYLSAPLNVHFNLTNKCLKQCKYCYTDSTPAGNSGLPLSKVKEIINKLSELKIFTIAYGGGEPFSREDIFEIAKYTREKGIVPNITTNGMHISKRNVEDCRIFGQVHISVDLLKENIPIENQQWHKAIQLLKKTGINVGINYIVNKESYNHLEDICYYGKKNGIKDIIFLRFKPFGRGKNLYNQLKLSDQENINFFPLIKKLSEKYQLRPMVDCSFLPMLYWYHPKIEILKFLGLQGCEGGNYIVEIDYLGHVRCCSFCKNYAGKAEELKSLWNNSPHFKLFRNWIQQSPYPCRSCKYLEVCKGGCHAIAEELTGNFLNPDPECPFIHNKV